ncbi:alpha/beta fold hydrolase [Rhodococcus phenolicus]|uniref:alpha/beta fold hydrolase n=1 Tax=Rhodococcus phenolicus TaxID=263849 RepID=UPI00083622C3|nr:alpha/beta hydrolase [Rhodococcus phenolicus]
MKKPSRRTALAVSGLVAVGTALGTAAARRRGTAVRSVVAVPGDPGDALLAHPQAVHDEVDVSADDGARLHVRAYGDPDADILVLSHGWTCSTDFWTPQINAFAEKYRVVVYDQRGHGRSETGSRVFGPDVLADDLAAVLAATVPAGRRAVLAGHSMGGISIMAWAERHPDQVRDKVSGVLLASTGMDNLVAASTIVPLPQRAPRVPVPVARRLMGATVPLVASSVTTRAIKYVALSPTATPAAVAFCEKIVLGCPPRTRGGWGVALSALDVHLGLANLIVPTTVLVGSADRLTPPSHAERLAAGLDEAGNLEHLVVVDGIGHMSSVEAIDVFNFELEHLFELAGQPVGS